MSGAIDFLITHGMAAEQIQDQLQRGIPLDEIVAAAERLAERGESLNAEASQNEKEGQQTGKFVSIEAVTVALQELGVTLRYNQLLKEAEVSGLPDCYSKDNAANVLPVYLADYLRSCGFRGATAQGLDGILACIADQNRYNPVKEYLQSGAWDGEDRFPEIFRILGVTSPRYQTYITKWFCQCVALGLNDDKHPIGADGVLVLQGEQGLAKTSFFRVMTPFPRWFVEGAIIDMGAKDSLITALSGWITELGELDSTLKKEQMSLKAFVTRPEDRIRMPYARRDTRAPRRTSFCGTVNPKDYLKDETGSRRFWTVPVTCIDKKALFTLPHGWVDQLWFQTYHLYQADPGFFRLDDQEIKELQSDNREFEAPLPYELELRELLDYSLPFSQWEWWRTGELARLMSGNADAGRVGRALRRITNSIFDDVALDETTSPKVTMVTTNRPELTRTWRGYPETLLPLKHFESNMVRIVT
ncbi:virulence-associated E family protein [Lawsonibacter sp. OA9]|nr:virulence-associated E family protein [Lawsonibacter sp. OA9]